MRGYACKFCIALYGLTGGDVPKLPKTRAEVETHLRVEHGYPRRSAQEILGLSGLRRAAATLIEETGAITEVRLIESDGHLASDVREADV
jgi:hypothetical protein